MNDVTNVLKTGAYIQQTTDKFLVMGKITVVITTAGELVTAWNNSPGLKVFSEVMRQFFGG